MNYNNTNQGSRAPFPPQYGGPTQPPVAGAINSSVYPNLSGLGGGGGGGGMPPGPQYPGAAAYPTQPGLGGYPPHVPPPPQQGGYPNPYGGAPPYGSAPPPPHMPPQQPAYGPPAGYQPPYGAQNSYQQGYRPSYNAPFDERAYLHKMFSEIDSNRDGRITGQELHEALRRGQPTSEFDPYTIQTLIEKYDSDRDNQISFDEFHSLFAQLNAQLNEFFDFDSDGSGSIDGRELGNILRRKGYQFSPDLFNYIVYEISRRANRPGGVTFDTYVRVIARFDFLRAQYNRNPSLQQTVPLEKYIRDSFF